MDHLPYTALIVPASAAAFLVDQEIYLDGRRYTIAGAGPTENGMVTLRAFPHRKARTPKLKLVQSNK